MIKWFLKLTVISAGLGLVSQPVFTQSAAQELEAWLSKSPVTPKKINKLKKVKNKKRFVKAKKQAPLKKVVHSKRKADIQKRTFPEIAQKRPRNISQKKMRTHTKTGPKTKKWRMDKSFSVRDMFMQKFSPNVSPKTSPRLAKTHSKKANTRLALNSKKQPTKNIRRTLPRKASLRKTPVRKSLARKPVRALPQQIAAPPTVEPSTAKVERPVPQAQPQTIAPRNVPAKVPSLAARPTPVQVPEMRPASSLGVDDSSFEVAQPASKDVLTNALNIVNRRDPSAASGKRPGSPQKLLDASGTFVDRTLNPNLAFHFNDKEAEYASVKIQFVDDRSNAGIGQIFPVGGVHVHLVGSDLKMAADAKGKIELTSMPVNSRFFLRVQDPAGRIESRLVEVRAAPGVQKINLYRKNQMSVLMQAAAVKPFPGTGNQCGVVRRRGINLDGVAVALNAQFDGPFYFDRSGVLDPRMRVTGSNGLFCMFNVDPGIKLISLFQGSSHLVDLPTTFQAQSSGFKELDIAGIGGLRLATRTIASTSSQLPVYSGAQGGVDIIPLGYSLPFTADQRGVYSSTYEVVRMDGRVRLFSRGSDVEPAIYNMNKEDTAFVADILPRGFIEDLAMKNQATPQKGFGSLFGRYGYLAGHRGQVTAEIYDDKGARIESVTSISAIDKDHEQFSFFNLLPGQYMVVIKDKSGDWLQSETTLVYADATSVLSIGSKTTFQ